MKPYPDDFTSSALESGYIRLGSVRNLHSGFESASRPQSNASPHALDGAAIVRAKEGAPKGAEPLRPSSPTLFTKWGVWIGKGKGERGWLFKVPAKSRLSEQDGLSSRDLKPPPGTTCTVNRIIVKIIESRVKD
jgi:hypothetical protein